MELVQELVPRTVSHAEPSLKCHTTSRARGSTSRRGPFSRSIRCLRSGDLSQKQVSPNLLSDRKITAEECWREFFSDPSQWWDNRLEKVNPRYPDFRHKKRHQSLWLNNTSNPPWVEAQLAALKPGTLQSDIVTWNARLRQHVRAGNYKTTIKIFHQMRGEGMNPDKFTFLSVLKACSSLRSLKEGRRVHEQIIERGYECDVYVGSCLVDMYAKCGSIEDAQRVFDRMPLRDVVSWNAMILGYVRSGGGHEALKLSRKMQQAGVDLDRVACLAVVNACASIGALQEGRLVHQQIISKGYECDVYVGNSLVDMYAKCGSIKDAHRVFDKMPSHTVVSWTAMILGYVKSGNGQKALELYRQMQQEGVEPNSVTFVAVLNACASVRAVGIGRLVHKQIIDRGYESSVFVANSLVDMYGKCGSIEDAQIVFTKMPVRDIVSWNAMIRGFVKCSEGQKALELFTQMQQEGVEPDPVTFVAVLNACASIAILGKGRSVHQQVIERGYESDVIVGNSLLVMYAECGSMEDAQAVFNELPTATVVAWTAMILGYSKSGEVQKALDLYKQMQQEGVNPDQVTFVVVLHVCASIAALENGKHVHEQIIENGYESDVCVGSSLVDMYAKCGSIEDAQRVFNNMPSRDAFSWTAMIAGDAMHGQARAALEHFRRMCQEHVEVNGVTFVCLLSACSHGGLVEEGLSYFNSMSEVYNVSPTEEHYACVVDLLGRAGRLDEAEDLIRNMPCQPGAPVWMSLLGACKLHGNVKMGERVAKYILELDPENASNCYVLLSNIYSASGRRDDTLKCQEQSLGKNMNKQSGQTCIEVNSEVHSFAINDRKHPQIDDIHEELERTLEQMKRVGYVLPDV